MDDTVSNSADNAADTDGSGSSDGEVLDLTEEVPSDESDSDEDAGLRDTIQTEDDDGDGEESSGEVPPSSVADRGEQRGPASDSQPVEAEPIEPDPIDEVPAGAETVEEDTLEPEDHEQGAVTVNDQRETGADEAESDEGAEDEEVVEPDPIDAPGDAPADEGAADEEGGEGVEVGDPPGEVYETVQMEAIDRTAIEREGQMRQLEQTLPLLSSRFAPEIVVGSPRRLIEDWGSGLPELMPSVDGEAPEPEAPEPEETPAEPPETPPEEKTPPLGETPAQPPSTPETVDETGETPQSGSPPAQPDDEGPAETPAIGTPVADAEEPPELEAEPEAESAPAPPSQPEESERDEELSEIVDELVEGEEEEDEEPAEPEEGLTGGWVQEVFGELYLATVPDSMENRTEREADFIEESFELGEDDNVLDLACGFGRHTIELVSRGYDVVGFDLSKPLLQKALQEAKRQSLKINFFHGDMRNLDFDGVFDACFCWQSSFGYFEDAVNLDVLARVNRALTSGGQILLDVMNRDYVIRKMPHRIWWEGRDCLFLEEGEFDFDTSVLHMNRSFIYEDGRPPIEQDWYIRLYSPHELRQMLGKAGFQLTELSGAIHYRGDFIGRDSPKLIAHADKVQSLG